MGTLIDTSVLVEAERGRIDLHEIARVYDDDAHMSVITLSELLHGWHRANTSILRDRRRKFIDKLLDVLPVVPVDMAIANEHAKIWAFLATQGNMIGMNDAWLAATCTANDLAIATFNVREFERVPGLNISLWEGPRKKDV